MPIVSFHTFLQKANSENGPFDYLIVGGGTAGLVIAHRLAQNINITVGIIEAGTYHGPSGTVAAIDTPGLIGRCLNDPLYDWAFQTEPQVNANNRPIPLPRGKGLGGSSLINYLFLTRPSKEEYDTLETTFNNNGWNWDKLLQCMKRSECFSQLQTLETRRQTAPPGSYVLSPDPLVHGTRGPIHHSIPPPWPPYDSTKVGRDPLNLKDLTFQTLAGLGVPKNTDPTNGNNIGYTRPFVTIDPTSGTRSSAVSGYFEPIVNSSANLFVLTGASATRVLFDRSDPTGKPKAVGVELHIPGHNEHVEVRNIRREIILSAGSLKTPEILECSGIGDPTILKQNRIECIVDLPGVGSNLQDHAAVSIIVEVDPGCVTPEILLDPKELEKHQKLYTEKKEGLLADVPSQGCAFLPLQLLSSVTGTPSDTILNQLGAENETHTQILHPSKQVQQGYEKQCQLQMSWLNDPHQAQIEIITNIGLLANNKNPESGAKKRHLTLAASLMHPFSRGTVHYTPSENLNSTATQSQHPKINPNILSHPTDYTLLMEGLLYMLHLIRTEPLKSVVKTWVSPLELSTIDLDKALKSHDNQSKAQLRKILDTHLRNVVRTIYHPIGTAAMMSREDGGVVDDQLRVYGVDGLRVADLSILPLEISSHTVSAAYAIGEMASEILIKAHNGER